MKYFYLSYFGYLLEFIVPFKAGRWARTITKIFLSKFQGYLLIAPTRKADLTIEFIGKKESKHKELNSSTYIYVVPLIGDRLNSVLFGQLFKEAFLGAMLEISSKSGSLCLHASSVAYGDRAIIFSGMSGAGKSTISSLISPPFTQLTDDLSFLIYQDHWKTAQLPIFEKRLPPQFRSSKEYIVKCICFIKQSNKNQIIEIMENTEKLQLLMKNLVYSGTRAELKNSKLVIESKIHIMCLEFENNHSVSQLLMEKLFI